MSPAKDVCYCVLRNSVSGLRDVLVLSIVCCNNDVVLQLIAVFLIWGRGGGGRGEEEGEGEGRGRV